MIYEFRCSGCGRRFDVYATLAEKEAGLSPTCPACGSSDVARVFGRVMLLRSALSDAGGSGPGGSDSGGKETDFGGGGWGGDGFGGDDGLDGGDDGFDGGDGLDGDTSSSGDDLDEDW
ncbi:MAG: zinc ribbon domain-containing protein [Bacillota bacterium]